MSYDGRCRGLALVFLNIEQGFAALTGEAQERLADELAQDIQDQIEASLGAFRDNGRFE